MFCSYFSRTLTMQPFFSYVTKFDLPVGVFTLKGGNKGETGNDTIIDNLELIVNTKGRSIVGRAKSRKDDLAVANDIKV